MKKKTKLSMVLLALLLVLAGCGKDEIPTEDYVQTNPASAGGVNQIMKSDTGYYYGTTYGENMSLHYFDVESGQNIYLCSKPECRHSGDAFCTATSKSYEVNSVCYYGGFLYLDVLQQTDVEWQYKLLRVSEDGSELTELITYMTVNNTSLLPIVYAPMIIHRGFVVLPYRIGGVGNAENGFTGTFLYNLLTEELTQLPELEYKTDYRGNPASRGRERFTGYGEYIYFNTHLDGKNTLSRYCLTDGTVEQLELLSTHAGRTYAGIYEVIDEDTIYYSGIAGRLYEYHISTKENITHEEFFAETGVRKYEDENTGETYSIDYVAEYECEDMMTDGTYLYVAKNLTFRNWNVEWKRRLVGGVGYTEEHHDSYVYVFDRELREVAKVKITTEDLLGYCEYFSFKILENKVYLQTSETVFWCPLEGFLKGTPNFIPLFDVEIDGPTTKDWELEGA